MGTTASPSHLLLLLQLPPSAPSHLSLSIRLHLPFPSAVQSHPLHLFLQCFTSTTPPSAAPSIPSSLPFLLPLLSLSPLSSLAVSLFFCPSVSPPLWAFDRSFRSHILKRILDITNPHRTLTVCGWTSASIFLFCFVLTAFFYCRHRRPFLPGVRVRTIRIGMFFLAAPYWPHDTPCQHSSMSTSVAHLWCSVVRHLQCCFFQVTRRLGA